MLDKKIELMSENIALLRNVKGIGKDMARACIALLHTINDDRVNPEKINELIKLLKDETSTFSSFRGHSSIIVAGQMSLEKNPENSLIEVVNINTQLKKTFSSLRYKSYLPMSSLLVYKYKGKNDVDKIIAKANEAHSIMKKNHRFLTSGDDICDAITIAMSFNDLENKFIEIEKIYDRLDKSGFSKGNQLQALSHMVSLGSESVDVKCVKVLKLRAAMRNNKIKISSYATPILGILALICDDPDEFAAKVKETDEQLKLVKGFGAFKLNSSIRKMISSTLVADYYARNSKSSSKVSILDMSNIIELNLITAIQIAAMTAVIAASSAAAAGAAAAYAS